MDITQKITNVIEPTVMGQGFDLVRVLYQGSDTIKTLQIMVERQDRQNMTIDDCEKLSKAISAVLDVEDVILSKYVLELTSPGVDRPLVKLEDFERFSGKEAKIETDFPIDGRRRFKGQLLGLDEERLNVKMLFEGNEVSIPFSSVSKAKLVLTDELVASLLKKK